MDSELDRSAAASGLRGTMINGGDTKPFDRLAGRAVMMLFLGKREWPTSAAALALLDRNRDLFDGQRASFVGVTLDPAEDIGLLGVPEGPGHLWLQDLRGKLGRKFGAVINNGGQSRYAPCWIVVDIRLRVIDHAPIREGERMFDVLRRYLAANEQQAETPAPVLIAPRIFDRELCRRLIDIYEREGGKQSGFVDLVDGRPALAIDHNIKRRADFYITDPALQNELAARLRQVVFPLIKRVFQFEATRIERLNIACYDGEERGFFRPHRDDRTAATVHRRFACTINLNAEDYDGGDLRFPEYGVRTYRAPTGGAAIFSAALLHEAMPVTRGKRYALLPFFFDEEGARQLQAYQAAAAQQ